MKTVHAIYEDGVFKPIGPVDLPDHCKVRFEPVPVSPESLDRKSADLSGFVGALKSLPIEPLQFQRSLREEWD